MSLTKSSKFTLGRKVTFWILFISGIFTILASAFQLYLDYKIELTSIEKTLSIIEKSHIKSLEDSVWFMNELNIKTKIEEMLKLPYITHLDLQLKGMDDINLGDLPAPNLRVQNSYHLHSKRQMQGEKSHIGTLIVTTSLEEVYATIKDKMIVILISQAIKTFFVSFFILFLIHSLITRHLRKIGNYITNIGIHSTTEPLELDRSKIGLHLRKEDELDLLEKTIKTMQTDLQNSMAALKESERNYREIFNATSDAIFILEGRTGKIIDVNKPMLAMYGYKKEEVLGLNPNAFGTGIAPYDQKAVQEKIKGALEKESQIFDWKAKKKNGEIFWVEIHTKFSKIGNEERIIAVVRDIEERKRTQEMMVQSEKMVSVGGLAAGMAHEINNPLAGMMQSAEVMNKRLTDVEIPANLKTAKEIGITMDDIAQFMEKREIPKMLVAINKSGRRMASIVNNMLSFSRKSNSQLSMHSLEKLLDKTFELASTDFDLKKHYDFKTIKIEKKYEGNLPLIPCDDVKIQQVLLNILRNGAQAMQADGTKHPTFTISTNMDKAHKMIVMEIRDNGPGMDSSTLKRIFEPFFTTKPVGVGTGLGLSVSYFIITETHNGELTADSSPGEGAKFIIRLPMVKN